MIKAFIFDMNGTMIDDMHYHTSAWNRILNQHGANISLGETKLQMYGKPEEMFERIFGKGSFSESELREIIVQKEQTYQEEFRPHLKLINGLDEFLQRARSSGIKIAIGTAALKMNVEYVLDGLGLQAMINTYVSAENVSISKPDPEVFLKCASLLDVSPDEAVVLEDAPKGIEAAKNGGFRAIAITSFHHADDFRKFDNLLFTIDNYENEQLNHLFPDKN